MSRFAKPLVAIFMSTARHTGVTAFAVGLLCLCAVRANADPVNLVINNPNQNLSFTGSLTFFGSITNASNITYNLGTPGHTGAGERSPFTYEVQFVDPTQTSRVALTIEYGLSGINNTAIPTTLDPHAGTGDIRLFSLTATNLTSSPQAIEAILLLHYYSPVSPGTLLTTSQRFTFTVSAVPEPATLLLLGTGVVGLALRRRH